MGFGLCGDEGLHMKIRYLRCVLTHRIWIHSAHSQWQSDYGRRVRRCSLGLPCVLNDVCISVNCIMANQLIFSTKQHVFIYDQYLLTQSASQVWRHFQTRFPVVKISSRSAVHNLYNKFQATRSVEPKKQHKPCSIISVTKLKSIEENYSELW